MKEKKKIVKISIITILIICIVFSIFYIKRKNNYIILTEFSPCSARQMMGYAIKPLNGKIIIIDGGTTDDVEQLEKYIVDNGSKVDAWFITHPHSDHAGAFEIISQNDEIKIDNPDFQKLELFDLDTFRIEKELFKPEETKKTTPTKRANPTKKKKDNGDKQS